MAKGNGCYWGWHTRGNRIAWALVVTFVVLGTAFWIPGVLEVKKCINTYNRCMCSATADGGYLCLNCTVASEAPRVRACYDAYLMCMKRPAAVWAVGWLFLAIMSWLPCCYFCCCSSKPQNSGVSAPPGAAYGVQMAPVAGTPPYSSQYGYPAAPPHSYAAPQPLPAPAYPAGGQHQLYQPSYDQNVPVHRY